MTETHPNLAAWLDGELPADEAAGVARHLESCESCRRQCAAFRDTSAVVALYCQATFAAAHATPRLRRWVPAFTALAAVASFTIFLAFPRKHVTPSPIPSAVAVVTQIPTPAQDRAVQAAPKLIHRHHSVSPPPRRIAAAWPPADTAVEIAIPADAVFAPGALPEGLRLFGEMRINPDGSLREIRLRQ